MLKDLSALSESDWGELRASCGDLVKIIEILLERQSRKRPGRKSTEKTPPKKKGKEGGKDRPGRTQLPSERYPDVEVVEKKLDFEEPPFCGCCQSEMVDSGLVEKTEQLTVIPKKYLIYRFLKKKYKCGRCHTGMATPESAERMAPGSSYSDDFIVDVALSKYCDLVPIERYAKMAHRQGLEGLPANSLVGLTHILADFLYPIYLEQRNEILAARVVHADETPHRMLEGFREKRTYYLWGFSTPHSCFFDIKNTRAGTVAEKFLMKSVCEFLVSDVYSAYSKGVGKVNAERRREGRHLILHAYCNAHARRKFKDIEKKLLEEMRRKEESGEKPVKGELYEELRFVNFCYRRIYRIEKEMGRAPMEEGINFRQKMRIYFSAMRLKCEKVVPGYSSHSAMALACRYFLKNYEELTRCLSDPEIPLDNNSQERLLRSPVVGRKTWYGTHSERGAKTAAILFTIVEACKLNGINPREYFPFVVGLLLGKDSYFTPHEYAVLKKNTGPPAPIYT